MKIKKYIRRSYNFIRSPNKYLKTLEYFKYRSGLIHKFAPYTWLDDKYWLEFYFYKHFRHKMDLMNPKTFNEKIQWMKLYDRNPVYRQLADKLLCRDFVKEKIGEKYLKPLLGVYENPHDINWTVLPAMFVIKTNHGSGWTIICKEKRKLDIIDVEITINHWLQHNFYKKFREWQYKDISPRIIVEPYFMGDGDLGLCEYQFYCFRGKVEFIQIDTDINGNHKRVFLNRNWMRTPFTFVRYPISEMEIPKPESIKDILYKVEYLTQGLRFCRVDLLIIDNNYFISEMTLSPGGGYITIDPPKYDLLIGEKILLN